jgi:hypothetical protein
MPDKKFKLREKYLIVTDKFRTINKRAAVAALPVKIKGIVKRSGL